MKRNGSGKLRDLGNDYLPPSDACNTYKVTFSLLREFEEDLYSHIYLENNILFPKAELLESKLYRYGPHPNKTTQGPSGSKP